MDPQSLVGDGCYAVLPVVISLIIVPIIKLYQRIIIRIELQCKHTLNNNNDIV